MFRWQLFMYMYAYVSLTIVLGCQPFSFPTFIIAFCRLPLHVNWNVSTVMRTFRVISRVIAPVILCVTYMYMYAYVSFTTALGCQPFAFPTCIIACAGWLCIYIEMFLLQCVRFESFLVSLLLLSCVYIAFTTLLWSQGFRSVLHLFFSSV